MKVNDLIAYLQTLPPEILESDICLKERGGIIRKAEIFRMKQEYVGGSDYSDRYYTDGLLKSETKTILEVR